MKRILVVDDDPGILELLDTLLSSPATAIITAASVDGALALLATTRFDVAIIDLNLSTSAVEEGLEIVRWIARHAPLTRALVFTGSTFGQRDLDASGLPGTVLRKPNEMALLQRLCLEAD